MHDQFILNIWTLQNNKRVNGLPGLRVHGAGKTNGHFKDYFRGFTSTY